MKTLALIAILTILPFAGFAQVIRTIPDSVGIQQPGSLLIATIPPGNPTNMPIYKPDPSVHYHLLIAGTDPLRMARNQVIYPPDLQRIMPPELHRLLPPLPHKPVPSKRLSEKRIGKE